MTQTQKAEPEDLPVSLTFHNFSADILHEFALKIVKPYFIGNMNAAIRSLMEKAIQEETLYQQAAYSDSSNPQ